MRAANRRVSRADCNNCTCSPGLLSRTNKRASVFAKRINIKRNVSGGSSPNGGSRKGSVFTIDAASLCLPDVKETNTSHRLEALRGAMAEQDIAVYIVPSEDQHQSEYVAPLDQRRSFISGFSGSAGTCIVTRDICSMNDVPEGLAALSTDGRYFSQANDELDFNWTLLKQGAKDMPTWEKWAVQQAVQLSLDSGKKVNIGTDPKLISFLVYEKLATVIQDELRGKPAAQVELVPVKENLIDKIWPQFEDVPAPSDSIIKTLDVKFAGEDASSKLSRVAQIIEKNNTHGLIVSALDEIAWLLNLRGSDIQYNPVFYSYLLLQNTGEATLFADNTKFDSNVTKHLVNCKVSVKPYDAFWSELASLDRDFSVNNKSFLLNTNASSWEIVRSLTSKYKSVSPSPIEDLKAVKNETELKGAHAAHVKDGRALVKFFAWLENQIINKSELIDEIEADDQLTSFRMTEQNFVGLSFDTISATGSNGAIIHYKPTKGYCKTIDPSKIYLVDSGSQYFEGTTDTTRTVHFGTPTDSEIKHYTLVLKGHVALGKLKFPENTTGSLIDSVARQYLWENGLDYGHGTAHGVGSYLNVHEGPIGIGPRPNAAKNALKPGHLISNEPGYYEEGEYGIRIENIMYVKDGDLLYNGKKFLEFETVTRVPYCRKLINVGLLSVEEKEWINKYHDTVWKELSPSLDPNSIEYKWLKRETRPL
ncbi:hypothetical protein JCM33374_g1534 [Metschnikowia sp. JCM 33374]|nr:hypothetical protein JCM33374_g1534 [Metschnikowia sp. JCM 33374]